MMVIIIIYHPTVNQQAVEALGQQPVPDENADAVMGAHTNGSFAECFFLPDQSTKSQSVLLYQNKSIGGAGGIERRHSSTEGGSFRGEPVVKITVNR